MSDNCSQKPDFSLGITGGDDGQQLYLMFLERDNRSMGEKRGRGEGAKRKIREKEVMRSQT
jgi:hypothetical protein